MPKPEGPQFTKYGEGMVVAPPPVEYIDEPKTAAVPPPPKRPPNDNADKTEYPKKKNSEKPEIPDHYKNN